MRITAIRSRILALIEDYPGIDREWLLCEMVGSGETTASVLRNVKYLIVFGKVGEVGTGQRVGLVKLA